MYVDFIIYIHRCIYVYVYLLMIHVCVLHHHVLIDCVVQLLNFMCGFCILNCVNIYAEREREGVWVSVCVCWGGKYMAIRLMQAETEMYTFVLI